MEDKTLLLEGKGGHDISPEPIDVRRNSLVDRLDAYYHLTFDPEELSRLLVISGEPVSVRSSELADWVLRKKEAYKMNRDPVRGDWRGGVDSKSSFSTTRWGAREVPSRRGRRYAVLWIPCGITLS